jgi:nuclear pore complex protein Nup160
LETEPVESRAEALWDEFIETKIDEDDSTALRRIMSNTDSATDALTDTLHLLGNAVDEEPDMLSEKFFSGYGNALLTSTIASTVQTRYELARSALLVSIFHLVDSGGAADDGDSESIVSIVNTAFGVYQRYRVLKWLVERKGDEADVKSKAGSYQIADTNALSNKTKDASRDGLDIDGFDPTYSLVHSLLTHDQVTAPSTGFNLLFDASEAYLTRLDLVDPAQPQLEPRDVDVRLANAILQQRHTASAKCFTELYPLSAGTAYVRGRACVELGELDEAFNLIKRAATGCKGEHHVELHLRATVMADLTTRWLISLYTPFRFRSQWRIGLLRAYKHAVRRCWSRRSSHLLWPARSSINYRFNTSQVTVH